MKKNMRRWDWSAYPISHDWSLGVELEVRDMNDECGRWLAFSVNLVKWGFEISRYVGVSRVTTYIDEGEDYMCPNCVTPWKCNGPHLTDGQK